MIEDRTTDTRRANACSGLGLGSVTSDEMMLDVFAAARLVDGTGRGQRLRQRFGRPARFRDRNEARRAQIEALERRIKGERIGIVEEESRCGARVEPERHEIGQGLPAQARPSDAKHRNDRSVLG